MDALSRFDLRRLAVVVVLCSAYALYCLWRVPAAPDLEPDSAGYLVLAPIHTLGYPLFLTILGPKGAIIAQPLLFSAALAWLGIETLRATSSVLLSAGVILVSMAIPDLGSYHRTILTESLFMSGLIMFLAAVIRFVRDPSSHAAALTAIIAGLTATVRRTGAAFLPVLPIMVLLQWRRLPERRVTILAAAMVPMLAVMISERIAARAVHGENLTSIVGRHLYAKAAMIEAPPPPDPSQDPLRARLEAQLDTTYAPIRAVMTRAPQEIRAVLALYYETCLQGPCVRGLQVSMSSLSEVRQNELLAQVGLERIARAPINFARLTALHYRSLWTAYKLKHPGTASVLTAFIASNRPLPFEHEAFALARQETLEFPPSEPVRVIQPVVVAIGWFTGSLALLGLAAASLRRLPSREMSIACLASLTAHLGLLFSAILAAGISRFMVSVWPAIMIAVVFGAWAVAASLRKPFQGRGAQSSEAVPERTLCTSRAARS